MKSCLIVVLLFFSCLSWGQLKHTTEIQTELKGASEADVRKEMLFQAAYKGIEKYSSEMGYKFEDFETKLKEKFDHSFESYQQRKLSEKFGAGYQETLSKDEKTAFLSGLESEKHHSFVTFSRILDCVRSHNFQSLLRDETNAARWVGKVELDLDKIKVEALLRKFILGETKQFAKLIILTEIEPQGFGWNELGLESGDSFKHPLESSWMKWYRDNVPSTVEEVIVCEGSCLEFYSKWMEEHAEKVSLPEEYQKSVLLKITMSLKRTVLEVQQNEIFFEWSGRTLLQDLQTKRVLDSFTLGLESRRLSGQDQKMINSALASSLYRSPLSAFLQFNRKLEMKKGLSRVSKLVIQGHSHLGDVMALVEVIKVRGSSLGIEVSLDSFSAREATLKCFYQGEEKSFSDLLSAIKELKSSHSYRLVNEFTGVHHLIKFVAE